MKKGGGGVGRGGRGWKKRDPLPRGRESKGESLAIGQCRLVLSTTSGHLCSSSVLSLPRVFCEAFSFS